MGRRVLLEKRFWEKVRKAGECWEFVGWRGRDGYGRIRGFRSQMIHAHRLSWILHYGTIPDELCVCHHCDNPPCVRPDHLFIGTHGDNARDREQKGRGKRVNGTNHHRSKLSPMDVRVIRRLYSRRDPLMKRGLSSPQIAEIWDVDQTVISKIIRREIWGHVVG